MLRRRAVLVRAARTAAAAVLASRRRPATLTATSTTGSVTLRVPGGVSYAVQASTRVGSTEVSVPNSRAARHVITARVTTGAVIVKPAP